MLLFFRLFYHNNKTKLGQTGSWRSWGSGVVGSMHQWETNVTPETWILWTLIGWPQFYSQNEYSAFGKSNNEICHRVTEHGCWLCIFKNSVIGERQLLNWQHDNSEINLIMGQWDGLQQLFNLVGGFSYFKQGDQG